MKKMKFLLSFRKEFLQIIFNSEISQSEIEILRKLRTNKFTNTVHSCYNRIIEIINNGNSKTTLKKLKHRVSADETRTTGDQDLLGRWNHFLDWNEREREREIQRRRLWRNFGWFQISDWFNTELEIRNLFIVS